MCLLHTFFLFWAYMITAPSMHFNWLITIRHRTFIFDATALRSANDTFQSRHLNNDRKTIDFDSICCYASSFRVCEALSITVKKACMDNAIAVDLFTSCKYTDLTASYNRNFNHIYQTRTNYGPYLPECIRISRNSLQCRLLQCATVHRAHTLYYRYQYIL